MTTFILAHETARMRAKQAISEAPAGYVVKISQPTRSLESNARLWVLLDCLAKQVVWHGQRLAPEEWKDVMTSALKRHRVVPGVDGGFVVLGMRTSQMTRGGMADLQTLIESFGAEHNVDFGERIAEPA